MIDSAHFQAAVEALSEGQARRMGLYAFAMAERAEGAPSEAWRAVGLVVLDHADAQRRAFDGLTAESGALATPEELEEFHQALREEGYPLDGS